MSRFSFFFLVVCSGASLAWGQVEAPLPNAFQIQVGDNYYGQSVALCYSPNLIGPLWADIALETGTIAFVSEAGQTFFLYENNSNNNYGVSLNIHDLMTVALSFHREDKGTFRWLNSLAVGLSYFDSTVYVTEAPANDTSDIFQGDKDISAFVVYADLHLLDFHPPHDKLFFSLGIKGNTAFLASPVRVITTNSEGQTASVTEASRNGGSIMFPDLELFLGLGYGFE